MAIRASGLQSYIWNNNWRSLAMLIAFPLLILVSGWLITVGWFLFGEGGSPDLAFSSATGMLPIWVPIALGVIVIWFCIAWFSNKAIVDLSMGSKTQSLPTTHPVYQQLETLCISRGITMPKLQILDTPARNAYASGLGDADAKVTVTQGLLDHLEPDEVEAVLAHELTHIQNRDVRTMMIAVVFVGIIALVLEVFARGMFRSSFSRSTRHRRSGGNNAALFIIFAIIVMAIAYFLAKTLRFAVSRSREYVADAGAVSLTRNPDAMSRALRKISGHADIPEASHEVRDILFCDETRGFAGWFSTHPPIPKRLDALSRFGGAQA